MVTEVAAAAAGKWPLYKPATLLSIWLLINSGRKLSDAGAGIVEGYSLPGSSGKMRKHASLSRPVGKRQSERANDYTDEQLR